MLLSSYVWVSDLLFRLRNDRKGVTAIEYGLIAGGIAVAIVTIVYTIGTDLTANFQTVADKLNPPTVSGN